MPRYSHAFELVFTVESDDPTGANVTAEQLRAAIARRLQWMLRNNDYDEVVEACGLPIDSYEIDQP